MPVAQGISPYQAGAVGVGVGVAGYSVAQSVQTARSRANWALGIGAVALAGEVLNSGNLNSQSQSAQSIAQTTNALSFTSGGATGLEVAALKAQVVNLANVVSQTAYYSEGIGGFLNTQPPTYTGTTAIAGTTLTPVTQSNNNTGLVLLLGVGLIAVAAFAS